jgi:hypothetical protein
MNKKIIKIKFFNEKLKKKKKDQLSTLIIVLFLDQLQPI